MEIISIEFCSYILISLLIYYIIPLKARWVVLLISGIGLVSIIDYRYLFFILFSIITSFAGGVLLPNRKKTIKVIILILVIVLNIGILFLLKYLDWFNTMTSNVLHLDGVIANIIIPIGISYYTLQIVGYVIDVYRGEIVPNKNIFQYVAFVLFFPQLYQGPIPRYNFLMPQIKEGHKLQYENIKHGAQLILWGLFKKLVIANQLSVIVASVYDNFSAEIGGSEVVLATIAFSIELYMDFSGCTDIVRGCGQLFGIDLPINFKQPYFATSLSEFWRNWHISLTSWFKDYIYIPLGGNKKGKFRQYINIIIIFIISGLWHGAGFKFIIWGTLHGLFQVIGRILAKPANKVLKAMKVKTNTFGFKFLQSTGVSILVTFLWIFFRAPSATVAFDMVKTIFTKFEIEKVINKLFAYGLKPQQLGIIVTATVLLVIVEYIQYKKDISIRKYIDKQPFLFRWIIYIVLIIAVILFGRYGVGLDNAAFIYEQF